MDYSVIVASILVFLVVTFVLVGMLLGAKAKLLPSGPVSLLINSDNDVEVSSGSTLLTTLGNNKIFCPLLVEEEGLVYNVSVRFWKEVEKFFLPKYLILPEKKLQKDGGWAVRLK